jgi:NAD(P)-dependent dehydrogenase (short-subunit alcohol dehydrogenase family)
VADCDEADRDRVFAVNVKGTYLMIRRLLPLIRAAGRGAIVNLASTAGLAGSATLGAYSASKGAVVMMTRSLAISHAAEGIRVTASAPAR